MALVTFGVAHGDVHDRNFPALNSFTTTTKPTAATVGKFIDAEAARLGGALLAKDVTPATINDSTTYPNAYAWCQDTIILGAAIRTMRAIAGAGAVPKEWSEELEARYAALDKAGYIVLGDAPTPSQQVSGPRSHISNHSLDTGDTDLISDVVPKFRRSDEL